MPIGTRAARVALLVVVLAGCARPPAATAPAPAQAGITARPVTPLDSSTQLVLVVTPAWDSTSGSLRRFERDTPVGAWRQVGDVEPIVVGRTGVAWDDRQVRPAPGEPVKREGDGRSPAGAFALDTAFGFNSRQTVSWVRLPYVRLRETTECVDDARSAHYNTIVERDSVPRVDWTSSEKMREIDQYAYGVHVAYNAPPTPLRGSCIFLHVWAGPRSVTAGCTAMEVEALKTLIGWIDPRRRPMLVQLPQSAIQRQRKEWSLP
jgi:D-alanyl-D-alanine dipeptidase